MASTQHQRRDHPRIRGEHWRQFVHSHACRGSSPHTRGAQLPNALWQTGLGIIPAYAGSTRSTLFGVRGLRDHPRIRGEHFVVIVHLHPWLGSSPHTRGAQELKMSINRVSRIIPAYAGSTPASCPVLGHRRDHPRIRGEHFLHKRPLLFCAGSSPHTRGAR